MAKSKIVFLDAGTVDWNDQDFSALKQIGQLKAYRSTKPAQILKRVTGFKHVITNKVVFDRAVLTRLKGVAAIHVAATGTNNVDLRTAAHCGIVVTNVRGYSTESVVQLTFASLLALGLRLFEQNQAVKKGLWSRQPLPTLSAFPFSDFYGKTLGIIGYGNIGRRVAAVAKVFGMKVLVAKIPGRRYGPKESRVSLGQLLRKADAVTIHAPLSDNTRQLIGAKELGYMKKTAFLLNMGRGGIVDEKALASALRSRKIAGAASDVMAQEPPPRNHMLYNAPRLILTPHIAWASVQSRGRLVKEIAANILAFERGIRRNRLV